MSSEEDCSCPVCFNSFNGTDNCPRILVQCGHSLCYRCLCEVLKLKKPQRRCPFDKTILKTTSLKKYPVNYILLQSRSQRDNVCHEHNESLKLVCLTEQTKICVDCSQICTQLGHQMKHIDKVKKEANDLEAELKNRLNQVEEQQNIKSRMNTLFDEAVQAPLLDLLTDLQKIVETVLNQPNKKIVDITESLTNSLDGLDELRQTENRSGLLAFKSRSMKLLNNLGSQESFKSMLMNQELPGHPDLVKNSFEKIDQVSKNLKNAMVKATGSHKAASLSFLDYSKFILKDTFQTTHTSKIRRMALLAIRQQIATCSDDKTIKIFDLETKSCIKTLSGHAKGVRDIIELEDGRILSCSLDRTIRIWDPSKEYEKRVQDENVLGKHPDYVFCLLELKNQQFLSGSKDKTINQWSQRQGSEGYYIKTVHNKLMTEISAFVLLNDEEVICGGPKDIQIVYLRANKVIKTLYGHTDTIMDLCLLPDKNTLLSASRDTTIRMWELDKSKCFKVFLGHARTVSKVLLFNSEVIVSASHDGTIKFWSLWEAKCLKTLPEKLDLESKEVEIADLKIMWDGSLLSSGKDKTIKKWSI